MHVVIQVHTSQVYDHAILIAPQHYLHGELDRSPAKVLSFPTVCCSHTGADDKLVRWGVVESTTTFAFLQRRTVAAYFIISSVASGNWNNYCLSVPGSTIRPCHLKGWVVRINSGAGSVFGCLTLGFRGHFGYLNVAVSTPKRWKNQHFEKFVTMFDWRAQKHHI